MSLGVAGHFDGRYVVSTARHVFDDEGYTTEFVLSGGIDRTLIALVDRHVPERHDGVHPAVVADINDPEQQGRVKLRFPWLSDSFLSNWAARSQVGAGHDRGIWWLPEIDDEVLVAFVDGDVSHPVVVGSLFNGVDLPPLDGYADGGDGLVDVRCLRTRAGHTIEFSDADGGELIRIATGDETITVLLDQANGKLAITTDGDLALETHGATSIVSDGDLSIETQGKLNISSQGAAEINSSSALKLVSNGQVDVSGALINLN